MGLPPSSNPSLHGSRETWAVSGARGRARDRRGPDRLGTRSPSLQRGRTAPRPAQTRRGSPLRNPASEVLGCRMRGRSEPDPPRSSASLTPSFLDRQTDSPAKAQREPHRHRHRHRHPRVTTSLVQNVSPALSSGKPRRGGGSFPSGSRLTAHGCRPPRTPPRGPTPTGPSLHCPQGPARTLSAAGLSHRWGQLGHPVPVLG